MCFSSGSVSEACWAKSALSSSRSTTEPMTSAAITSGWPAPGFTMGI